MRISDWSSDVCSSDLRNALKRFGEILVGEFGDVLGDDHIDRRDRVALLIERLVERGAETGDDDLVLARDAFSGGVLRPGRRHRQHGKRRSEEHTSELQSLMRISYAVFCLQKTSTSLSHDINSVTKQPNTTYY